MIKVLAEEYIKTYLVVIVVTLSSSVFLFAGQSESPSDSKIPVTVMSATGEPESGDQYQGSLAQDDKDQSENNSQIYFEYTLMKIKDSELREIKLDGILKSFKIPADTVEMLREKSEIILSSSIVTQNGEETTLRTIVEKYYPEAWSDPSSSAINNSDGKPTVTDESSGKSNEKSAPVKVRQPAVNSLTSPMPIFGSTTETGLRITLTPTLDKDGKTVALDLTPVLQTDLGTRGYGKNDLLAMPIIGASTVSTAVSINNGETLLYSAESFKEGGELFHLLGIISAQTVKPDGSPGIAMPPKSTGKTSDGDPETPENEDYSSPLGASIQIIEIPHDEVKQILSKEKLKDLYSSFNGDIADKITRSEKSKIIMSMQIVGLSGQESNKREVREEYFPSSYTEPELIKSNDQLVAVEAMPELGETTDVGNIFTFTATNEKDGTFSVQLNPQSTNFCGWSEWDYSMPAPESNEMKSVKKTIKMPNILRLDFVTNITVTDGVTFLIARNQYRDLRNPTVKLFSADKKDNSDLKDLFVFFTVRSLKD